MSEQVEFRAGDKVVYPAHGVGQIIGQEVQVIAGMEIKVYVVSFLKDKMILRVPVNRAKISGLRALSTTKLVEKAIATLKGRARPSRGMWSRRAQEYEAKINSGDMISIAEVVRDLHKNVDDPDRSYSERIIYESALGRLAGEMAAVESMSAEDATKKLENVLKMGKPANSNKKVKSRDDQEDGLEAEIDEPAFEAA